MKPRSRMSRRIEVLLGFVILTSPAAGNPWLVAQTDASTFVHRSAPNFFREDLSHKQTIELASYRGKVVLLNFWATWCAPCLTEMPAFEEWQKVYGRDRFQVIGISMDDTVPEVIATVSRLNLSYPMVMGDEHLGAAYGGVMGLPVTFLIDRQGRVQARYEAVDLARIKGAIETLLKPR